MSSGPVRHVLAQAWRRTRALLPQSSDVQAMRRNPRRDVLAGVTVAFVALPLALPGYAVAALLAFAHTIGEFGVVLMMGGNIPGKTRVISVQIYDHVESLEFVQGHWLAGGLLVFSFCVLLILSRFNPLDAGERKA